MIIERWEVIVWEPTNKDLNKYKVPNHSAKKYEFNALFNYYFASMP